MILAVTSVATATSTVATVYDALLLRYGYEKISNGNSIFALFLLLLFFIRHWCDSTNNNTKNR